MFYGIVTPSVCVRSIVKLALLACLDQTVDSSPRPCRTASRRPVLPKGPHFRRGMCAATWVAGSFGVGKSPELDLNAEGLCHMKTSPTSKAQGLRQESSIRSLSRVPWEVTVKPRRTRSPALVKGTAPTPTFNGLTCLLKTRLYPSLGRTLQTLTFVIIFMVGKVMVKLLDRLVELPAGRRLVLNFPTHLPQDFKVKRGSQKCTSLF